MLANEDMNLATSEHVGRDQDVFMPESVDVTALEASFCGVQIRTERIIVEAQRCHPQSYQTGNRKAKRFDQRRVTDFHRSWHPCQAVAAIRKSADPCKTTNRQQADQANPL